MNSKNELYESLYKKYYKKVYAFCLLKLKNVSLAEEVAQEAFFKAYLNLHKLENINNFNAWILRIARNCIIDNYRANQKFIFMENEQVMYIYENKNLRLNYDLAEKMEKIENFEDVCLEIKKFNKPLKNIMLLRYFYDKNNQEIAEILDIPLGTVKSSLYRAKKNLNKKLVS